MKNIKKVCLLFVVFASIFTVSAAYAQNETELGSNTNNDTELGASDSGNSEPSSIQLTNPLGTTKTLPDLIEGLLRIVLSFGIPVIALAIIYAGFLFVAAQGNPTKLQEARRTLLYVLIGAAILLASYVIAEAIGGTINAIRGNN
jgi:hypothetical protein